MTRNEQLQKWLDDNDAHFIWGCHRELTKDKICGWTINGKFFLIIEYKDGGWELLVPVSDSISIKNTLDAAGKYLGCQGFEQGKEEAE